MDLRKGNLCSLSSWKDEFASLIVDHANNKKIELNLLEFPHPYTKSDAEFWINLNKQPEMQGKNFAICVESDGLQLPVGGIGIKTNALVAKKHCVEVGYWLGEIYWGRGIVVDALKVLLEYIFSEEFTKCKTQL